MTERLSWAIDQDNDLSLVKLKGSIDEDADFTTLTNDLQGTSRLRFDMSEVSRVNSCGVREWMNFIRGLPSSNSLELASCSPVIVSQINMITNFIGTAKVLSVQAPFVCDACGHEVNVLLQVSDGTTPGLAGFTCPECSEPLEFDDIEDSYFAFLT